MITATENRILYLIGAGFSAPLGLPVMANFISRSKDLYFRDRKRYSHFENVYAKIATLSNIKNTFKAELTNIEEILSLLEMEAFIGGSKLDQEFVRFLSDVVNDLLPEMMATELQPGSANWHNRLFEKNPIWKPYMFFVASLLNLQAKVNQDDQRLVWTRPDARDRYAVVTLNYDRVIETVFKPFSEVRMAGRRPALETKQFDPEWWSLQLAKLHGCAQQGNIVPPTWRKGNDAVNDAWKLAFELIKSANHIRIVGYSLPLSDSYLRYLLKTAIHASPDLKTIEVINVDPNKGIQQRYSDFIDFGNFRFLNTRFESFLDLLVGVQSDRFARAHFEDGVVFDSLEIAHKRAFEESR